MNQTYRSDNDILMEAIKTQIDAVKQFTQELILLHSAIKSINEDQIKNSEDIKTTLKEILAIFQNGFKDDIRDKVREENNLLYYKLVATVTAIIAITITVAKLLKVM